MRSRIEEQNDIAVDMAPLIDCVFLLLIFFLVATTMRKIERELPIELPDAAMAIEAPHDPGALVIGLDQGGQLYLNGEEATIEQLNRILRTIGEGPYQPKVRIDADRAVAYQHLLHILDQAAFYGIHDVRFHVRR